MLVLQNLSRQRNLENGLAQFCSTQTLEKPTRKLVEFKSESNGKEEQLVGNSDEQRYCEVVIVQGMDFGHDGAALVEILVEMIDYEVPLYRLSSKEGALRSPSYMPTQLNLNGVMMSHSPVTDDV